VTGRRRTLDPSPLASFNERRRPDGPPDRPQLSAFRALSDDVGSTVENGPHRGLKPWTQQADFRWRAESTCLDSLCAAPLGTRRMEARSV
jgi:hypothetical protein